MASDGTRKSFSRKHSYKPWQRSPGRLSSCLSPVSFSTCQWVPPSVQFGGTSTRCRIPRSHSSVCGSRYSMEKYSFIRAAFRFSIASVAGPRPSPQPGSPWAAAALACRQTCWSGWAGKTRVVVARRDLACFGAGPAASSGPCATTSASSAAIISAHVHGRLRTPMGGAGLLAAPPPVRAARFPARPVTGALLASDAGFGWRTSFMAPGGSGDRLLLGRWARGMKAGSGSGVSCSTSSITFAFCCSGIDRGRPRSNGSATIGWAGVAPSLSPTAARALSAAASTSAVKGYERPALCRFHAAIASRKRAALDTPVTAVPFSCRLRKAHMAFCLGELRRGPRSRRGGLGGWAAA
eukprot:scaffold14711_cov55-Phaeocystis_antarctica.AAC.4